MTAVSQAPGLRIQPGAAALRFTSPSPSLLVNSRTYNLLGPNPTPEKLAYYSNEKQVTAQTPPTFLFHTAEDKAVPMVAKSGDPKRSTQPPTRRFMAKLTKPPIT